jgi:hypothetical protein
MSEIKINIECSGKYCGNCSHRAYARVLLSGDVEGKNANCQIFSKNLTGEKDFDTVKDSERCRECLDAERNYRHAKGRESCNNCQKFDFIKEVETKNEIKVENKIYKYTTRRLIGKCLIAEIENLPNVEGSSDKVCDFYVGV